ncbi:MAG: hypothetical protein LBC71_08950 [Oscillospiraceae bacterium]|jgi:hypothetical protein|nr:hypothetical protein [Oscillospiraceae bacterium]
MLFNKKIEPSCSYCVFGVNIGQNEIACKKRGIMSVEGDCNAFAYEPTKREPEFAGNLNTKNLSKEDFII